MSPAPRVILLDSCAYFRLARSIHLLLVPTFGVPQPYSLFVLAALDDEYLTSSKLKHKFEWVNAAEYKADREGKKIRLSRQERERSGHRVLLSGGLC